MEEMTAVREGSELAFSANISKASSERSSVSLHMRTCSGFEGEFFNQEIPWPLTLGSPDEPLSETPSGNRRNFVFSSLVAKWLRRLLITFMRYFLKSGYFSGSQRRIPAWTS